MIHELLRIVEKWSKIIGYLKQLLPQIMEDPNITHVKFKAKAKLTHQEVVRTILQFVRENMILDLETNENEEKGCTGKEISHN